MVEITIDRGDAYLVVSAIRECVAVTRMPSADSDRLEEIADMLEAEMEEK